jgi:hypothetical protein
MVMALFSVHAAAASDKKQKNRYPAHFFQLNGLRPGVCGK